MRRRHTFPLPLVLIALSMLVAALACNLTDNAPPPSLVPRATFTPPPTIGFPTLAPEEFPDQATNVPRVETQTDTTLLNVMNRVEPDRLIMHIDALVGMRTRHVLSSWTSPTEGIGAAYNYILNQFNLIRDQSYQNSFAVLQPQEFAVNFADINTFSRNIIGVLQGTETGAGIILIGAHYDSITRDVENGNTFAPGANDNASGIAALMEIARVMSQTPHRATVMFVAFGAEEIQRKGSTAFVNDYLRANNIQIDAMFNMDVIGSSTSGTGAVNDYTIRLFSAEPNESSSRHLARTLNLLGARLAPGMAIDVQPTVDRDGRYGDHMSFSDAGFASVRFTEALEEPDRHHTERDTKDDIQISYLMRATQTILAVTTAMADGLRPPRSVQLREGDNGFRTLVWERVPEAAGYLIALRPPGSLIYSDYFEVNDNQVTWDGFRADRFASVAVAAKDASGLIGPFSFEYTIGS
ncbi:MAG: M20/M25/M40 family metallo-hydrolase [Anaerolineae bacterium]|nr:M20/M25/M40 family metallo-hydrolase [Anaerolineae bacterium]